VISDNIGSILEHATGRERSDEQLRAFKLYIYAVVLED